MANAEIKLSEFCSGVRKNLARCTTENKRLALDTLDIKVVATKESIEIEGAIPTDITTTQTSEDLLTTART